MFFFKKKKTRAYAPAYQAYLTCFDRKPDLKVWLREVRFVVLDTETTGLDTKKDRILSLAALEVKDFDFSVHNRLELIVKQERYQPKESITVHGILQNKTERGVPEKEMLEALLAFLKGAVIVGHHIAFDIAILNESMLREMSGPLKNPVVDTAEMARRIKDPFKIRQPNPQAFSLDNLCLKYNIEMGKRHTAAEDAYLTALLFLKLLSRLERKGIKTLEDLLA